MKFEGIWDVIPTRFNYLARDESGVWYVFEKEPHINTGENVWLTPEDDDVIDELLDAVDQELIDPWDEALTDTYWEDSLQRRGPTWNLDHVLTL